MLNIRREFQLLSFCFCGLSLDIPQEVVMKSSLEKAKPFLLERLASSKNEMPHVPIWPTNTCPQSNNLERIYKRQYAYTHFTRDLNAKVWLFDLPKNPATRWLQLNHFIEFTRGTLKRAATYTLVRRGCCIDCASCAPLGSFTENHLILL